MPTGLAHALFTTREPFTSVPSFLAPICAPYSSRVHCCINVLDGHSGYPAVLVVAQHTVMSGTRSAQGSRPGAADACGGSLNRILGTLWRACLSKEPQAVAAAIAEAQALLPSLQMRRCGLPSEPHALLGDSVEHTLLTLTVRDPHPANAEIARQLLAYGAGPDVLNGRALKWAAKTGQHEVVRVLLEGGAGFKFCSKDGRTPLHFALESACSQSVRYILEAGADANGTGRCGAPPLLALSAMPAMEDAPDVAAEIVRLLLLHGADIRATRHNVVGGAGDRKSVV